MGGGGGAGSPPDDERCVLVPVEDESGEMSDSDAVDPSTAPDKTVLGVEAVSRERPGQDPREEDEADPPAAVDHLQDEAEPEQEEEVGHNVLQVSVDETVGQIPPGLVPVITEGKNIFISQNITENFACQNANCRRSQGSEAL